MNGLECTRKLTDSQLLYFIEPKQKKINRKEVKKQIRYLLYDVLINGGLLAALFIFVHYHLIQVISERYLGNDTFADLIVYYVHTRIFLRRYVGYR